MPISSAFLIRRLMAEGLEVSKRDHFSLGTEYTCKRKINRRETNIHDTCRTSYPNTVKIKIDHNLLSVIYHLQWQENEDHASVPASKIISITWLGSI